MRQYETYERCYDCPEPAGSQVAVDLVGVFTHEDGVAVSVKGFYDGHGHARIRFLPEKPGRYICEIRGLITDTATVTCEPAAKGRHGLVRADGTHFRHADGTWCHPFGTTIYALSHQDEELTEQTFDTLSKAPFNKIRMCVFPKHYDFNLNEPPCFAFEKTDGKWDVHRPCAAFWERFEAQLRRLDEMGIQSDLILFHPYDRWDLSVLSREECLVYLDYALRRLSAFPNIWWSLANEYDLLEYTMDDWYAFARFIHEADPYGHLLSNHEMVLPWDYANPDTTHICHQTSYIDYLSLEIEKFQKPLMVDECCYEGNIPHRWGNISGFELVHRFWTVCAQGGYCTHGETFLNKEEILWWSRGGRLVGESPARIGFLREILEELPGPLTFASFTCDKEGYYERQKAYTEEEKKNSRFIRLLSTLPYERGIDLAHSRRELYASCGKEAYLKYYGKRCTSKGNFALPKDGLYDIEVIDIWEMTRDVVARSCTGSVEVTLPGKEGIAILAKKVG